jgi:hypothetical protein
MRAELGHATRLPLARTAVRTAPGRAIS